MTLSTLASKYSPNILAKLNHQRNNQASVKIDFFFPFNYMERQK